MDIECNIPITTTEGFEYLLIFSKFASGSIPEEITIPVVNLSIEVKENPPSINNLSTLAIISSNIEKYLHYNDVILYCYCDNAEITKSKKNEHMSHQQYRSTLFSAMFDKKKCEEHLNEKVTIEDEINGTHYIHLISKIENTEAVAVIASTVLKVK